MYYLSDICDRTLFDDVTARTRVTFVLQRNIFLSDVVALENTNIRVLVEEVLFKMLPQALNTF